MLAPPGEPIQQRFDIKGSWVDRNTPPPRPGALLTCRHCNRKFTCGVIAIGRRPCRHALGSACAVGEPERV